MAVLTWRDVSAPDASQALYGLSNAGKGINDAFSNLAQGLQNYQNTQENAANAAGLARAMQYQNPDDLRAAMASGAFSTQGMSAAGIQALNTQMGSQIEQRLNATRANAAQHDLDQTLNDENFQQAHPDLMNGYQAAIASGNPDRIAQASNQLSAAGANWNMLQSFGKNAGALGQQAAAIRASNASAAQSNAELGLVGARQGLINAQTQEIQSNIGLKSQTAALGATMAQAASVNGPAGALGVLNDYQKSGGDMRAAAPYVSSLMAQALAGRSGSGAGIAGIPTGPVGSGTTGKGKSAGFTGTGQNDLDNYAAQAVARISGNNPNADMGTLQQAQDSREDWSNIAPTVAKNFNVSVDQLNPIRDRIKAYAKANDMPVPSDAAVAEIISRRTRPASILHPSEYLNAFNDFGDGRVVDRNGVLADLANLKPDADGMSPGQKALALSQQTDTATADIQRTAEAAANARQTRIGLVNMQAANPDNPYIQSQLDRATQLENAFTNRLKAMGAKSSSK